MRIDFSQKLKNLDGTIPDDAPILSDICINSIMGVLPHDQNLSGADKFKLAELARKIFNSGEIEISVEDVSKIKDRIGMAYSQLIVWSAWNLLEGKE